MEIRMEKDLRRDGVWLGLRGGAHLELLADGEDRVARERLVDEHAWVGAGIGVGVRGTQADWA